jgi:prophage antirepressor-like protein
MELITSKDGIFHLAFLIDDKGVPYFKGKEIADILGYQNTNKAINDHVPDKYRKKLKNFKGSNYQENTVMISEYGLYSLIFNSQMEKAQQFRDWVFESVLPQIRKSGEFQLKKYISSNKELIIKTENGDNMKEINKRINSICKECGTQICKHGKFVHKCKICDIKGYISMMSIIESL